MKNNIWSMGQLSKKGYDSHMKNYSLLLRDWKNNLIVKELMTQNRIFLLDVQNDTKKCLIAYVKDVSWL